MAKKTAEDTPITIKKYANRRLYNTETSAYITLEDLCQMVRNGKDFIVVDANSGADLTTQILAQIIYEQETKGVHLLPANFLRQVIRFYDDSMGGMLQHYLEASMKSFIHNQDRMRGMMGKAMQDFSPFGQLEEVTRQNVAFFEKAMHMFTPFGGYFGTEEEAEAAPKKSAASKAGQ